MEIVLIVFSSITIILVSVLIFIFLKKPQETGLRELQNELTEKFSTNLERLSNISRNIDSINETTSTMSIPIQNLNTYLGGNVTAGRLGEWNLESLVADVLPNTKFETQKKLFGGVGRTKLALEQRFGHPDAVESALERPFDRLGGVK